MQATMYILTLAGGWYVEYSIAHEVWEELLSDMKRTDPNRFWMTLAATLVPGFTIWTLVVTYIYSLR